MSLPTVAIVGRPNVGKSSLFNRIVRQRLAVVDARSGVTRDRNYAVAEWNGVEFQVVDTGGMVPDTRDQLERAIHDQSEFAIHEADLTLLVVDVQIGADLADRQLAQRILKSGRPCLLLVNKVDNESLESDAYEFMKLGLGEPYLVSATTGNGVADVLDIVVAKLPKPEAEEESEGIIRVALVGRPNVGKSSFINKLLGEERLVVSEEAGTTRDAVDTAFEWEGNRYVLIDTAGLRRKYKVHENVEFYTYLRTVRAIDTCHVAVVLIDGSQGITSQDQRVLEDVLQKRRAAVLAVNKWDLVEKDSRTADQYTASIKDELAKYAYLPVMYVSALTGQRVVKVLSPVNEVYAEYQKRIPTSALNKFLEKAFARQKPPARQRKFIQFKYVTQTEVAPPTFVFFVNHPQLVDRSYIQYLSNQLRAEFGFVGVPIRVKCRRK
jgi:GTP-binding protein